LDTPFERVETAGAAFTGALDVCDFPFDLLEVFFGLEIGLLGFDPDPPWRADTSDSAADRSLCFVWSRLLFCFVAIVIWDYSTYDLWLICRAIASNYRQAVIIYGTSPINYYGYAIRVVCGNLNLR